MKNKNLLWIGLALLILGAIVGRNKIAAVSYADKIMGAWILDAYEMPPNDGKVSPEIYDMVEQEYAKMCKERTCRYEFTTNQGLKRYFDDAKTVESGTFDIQGDKFYEILETGDLKASTGTTPQTIVKLNDDTLILERPNGIKRFFVRISK